MDEGAFRPQHGIQPPQQAEFPGDDRHDIRDHMLDRRAETLSIWTGWVADRYLAAARMLGRRDDPVADSLLTFDSFDLATLSVAHDYMAANWRYQWLPRHLSGETPDNPDTIEGYAFSTRCCRTNCLAVFRNWLRISVDYDAQHAPEVIRAICLVLVQQNTASGYIAEIDLFDTLRKHYPLPPLAP